MLRKDYIMRQFEEFGIVIGTILGLKRDKEWEKFENEIDKAVKRFTDLELSDIIDLSFLEFKELVDSKLNLKPDQMKILADLLYERSISEKNKNNETIAGDLIQKSLHMYLKYKNELTENQFNLEVHYRIELLSKILNQPNQL